MIKATLRYSNSGPQRKYYHLTGKGITALIRFRQNWKELDDAVNQLLRE